MIHLLFVPGTHPPTCPIFAKGWGRNARGEDCDIIYKGEGHTETACIEECSAEQVNDYNGVSFRPYDGYCWCLKDMVAMGEDTGSKSCLLPGKWTSSC